MSLRHRHEYAVDLPRGLPTGFGKPTKELPDHPKAAGTHRVLPVSARFEQVAHGGT